mgnify:CR=1 FL=1
MADTPSLDPTHSFHLRHAEEYELIVEEAVHPKAICGRRSSNRFSSGSVMVGTWVQTPALNTSKKTPTKAQ